MATVDDFFKNSNSTTSSSTVLDNGGRTVGAAGSALSSDQLQEKEKDALKSSGQSKKQVDK